MNPEVKQHTLLADVLVEGDDFRETLLGQVLHTARKRRRARQTVQSIAVTLFIAAVAIAIWPRRATVDTPMAVEQYRLTVVVSRPLPASAIVATSPRSVRVVSTLANSVAMFSTPPTVIEELTDEELLARAREQAAILVRHSSNHAELIFADEPE